MNLAEILDELGSRQLLGIVRVSGIQFPNYLQNMLRNFRGLRATVQK